MAAQRISSQQANIQRQYKRSHADAEADLAGCRIGEPERMPDIGRQKEKEDDCQVHEIAVDVLQNERERIFAPIRFSRLADRAIWRISPERFVICPAIVIAGKAESARRPEDQ